MVFDPNELLGAFEFIGIPLTPETVAPLTLVEGGVFEEDGRVWLAHRVRLGQRVTAQFYSQDPKRTLQIVLRDAVMELVREGQTHIVEIRLRRRVRGFGSLPAEVDFSVEATTAKVTPMRDQNYD